MGKNLKDLIKEFLDDKSYKNYKGLYYLLRNIVNGKHELFSFYSEILKERGVGNSIDDITHLVIELFSSRKMRWKKDTGEMTAFEYAVTLENPKHFLFDKRGSALTVLLEKYIKGEKIKWGESEEDIIENGIAQHKEIFIFRDNAGRVLRKKFKQFSDKSKIVKFGLPEWEESDIDLSPPNNINDILEHLPIPSKDFKKLTYEKQIQRLLIEVSDLTKKKTPLTKNQIITTIQRLLGLFSKEEPLEARKDEEGEEIGSAEENISVSEEKSIRDIHAILPDAHYVVIKVCVEEFFSKLITEEKRILKLRRHDEGKPISYEEVSKSAPDLGSQETIRQKEKEIFRKTKEFMEEKSLENIEKCRIFVKTFLELL